MDEGGNTDEDDGVSEIVVAQATAGNDDSNDNSRNANSRNATGAAWAIALAAGGALCLVAAGLLAWGHRRRRRDAATAAADPEAAAKGASLSGRDADGVVGLRYSYDIEHVRCCGSTKENGSTLDGGLDNSDDGGGEDHDNEDDAGGGDGVGISAARAGAPGDGDGARGPRATTRDGLEGAAGDPVDYVGDVFSVPAEDAGSQRILQEILRVAEERRRQAVAAAGEGPAWRGEGPPWGAAAPSVAVAEEELRRSAVAGYRRETRELDRAAEVQRRAAGEGPPPDAAAAAEGEEEEEEGSTIAAEAAAAASEAKSGRLTVELRNCGALTRIVGVRAAASEKRLSLDVVGCGSLPASARRGG